MAPSPNVLFILTDQQRWDALGCVGGWVRTPNIDALAAEGALFTNCLTNAPVCAPARVSLMTGRYPHQTGVWRNQRYTLPPSTATWVQAIRRRGYRTSLFGKTHLHPQNGDFRDYQNLLEAYGFDDVDEIPGPQAAVRVACRMTDRWRAAGLFEAFRRDMRERKRSAQPIIRASPLGLAQYYDVYVGRAAAAYLKRYDRKEPWFCWVGFPGPHVPWDAPESYGTMYDPSDMPAPVPFAALQFRGGAHRPRGWLDRKLVREGGAVGAKLSRSLRANYAGSVTLIDDLIGSIVDAIKVRGEYGRTIVILASDHGEMNGDFGLVGKSNMLDGAVRIPLIVRLPGSSGVAAPVYNDPVELMDVGPTILDLIGSRLEGEQYAQSLVPLLIDPTHRHRDEALVEHRGEVMLCDESWKITVNSLGKPYLLFDRRADVREMRNLAGLAAYRDVEDHLMGRMRERLRAAPSSPSSNAYPKASISRLNRSATRRRLRSV